MATATTSDQDRALEGLLADHDALEVKPRAGGLEVQGHGPCGPMGDASYLVLADGQVIDTTPLDPADLGRPDYDTRWEEGRDDS